MRVRFADISLSAEAAAAYNTTMSNIARPVNDAITDLRDQVEGYSWAKLIFLGPIFGGLTQAPESTRDAIHSALGNLSNRMVLLDRDRALVLSGKIALNKWIAGVNAVFDGVKSLAKDLDESSILSESIATLADSINQAKMVIEKYKDAFTGAIERVGTGLQIGLPLLGVAAILAAVFVLPKLLGTTVVVRGK